MKAKFFELFQVIHPVGKQIYKLELSKKWKIYDVFHVLLLEQDITRKERVNKDVTKLDTGNESGEYKIETICDSVIYPRESESGHLPRLYYLIFWKKYPKEKNTQKPALAVQHFRKLIRLFHKNHFDKSIATSKAINTLPPIGRPTIKPIIKTATGQPKRKQGQSANSSNKRAKKT